MNERQARTQHKLSTGGDLGQDSSDNFNDKKNVGGDKVEEIGDDKKTITKTTFIIMIGVGLILDVISLIPFLGWFFSTVVLILIYLKLGVKFHLKNILKFGSCDLIELIPVINVVPAFTLATILNLGPMVEGIEDLVPAGEAVAHKVQKMMSMTKKG
jgi:hypothetical protein